MDDVKKLLSAKSQYICITSAAWSSVLNEPIINYIPTHSLFLEAVHTEEQSHDAVRLTGDLVRVMDNLGNNVVGAITDNTSTNRKVWQELEMKYPNRFFHGGNQHLKRVAVCSCEGHAEALIHAKFWPGSSEKTAIGFHVKLMDPGCCSVLT
jgi:hypothetical protein